MKKALLLIAAAMVAISVSVQAGWMESYGGEGHERGDCVRITSDNDYIVAGNVDEDVWILKAMLFQVI